MPPDSTSDTPLIRKLWVVAGSLCVLLGLVGIPLPLIPTTPFLLLAAYCYSRGSTKLHTWLISHRVFGPPLRRWREQRGITRRDRRTAVITVLVTIGLSILAVDPWPLRLMLVLIAIAVCTFLCRLKLVADDRDPSEPAETSPSGTPRDLTGT